tara:strand:+ start:2098 stop:2970 length:873 start_codon:yes stop_codon:yes gene_type:complete
MIIKRFNNAPKFTKLQAFNVIVQTGSVDQIADALADLAIDPDFAGLGWQSAFSKLGRVIATSSPEFSIFAMGGNSKLPFISFSTLPGVTCPGAGDCVTFCYSFRAWRYPSAWARQVQNAFLMRFNVPAIGEAFAAISDHRPNGFDFRLYVDGDFANTLDVQFWMNEIRATPKCRAYGYSKSFAALLAFDLIGQWPINYQLNISGGHNASDRMVKYVKALPITRGEFIAVSIGRKVKSSDHGTPAVNAALRLAMGDTKIFPCPGACGSCTGKGHACGMPELKGRVIAIAMH